MSPDELAKYLSSPQELSDMFMEQDEVKAIRSQILRLTESLKNQTDENVEEKSQL